MLGEISLVVEEKLDPLMNADSAWRQNQIKYRS
jgi:hypothetical protein